MSARTTSGVKRSIPVEGWAAVGNGCCGNVADDGRGGLADGEEIGGGCAVADGGIASADLADGNRAGRWDCPLGGSCLAAPSKWRLWGREKSLPPEEGGKT